MRVHKTTTVAFALIHLAGCGGPAPETEAAPARDADPGTGWIVADTMLTDQFIASGTAEPFQRAVLATKLMAKVTAVLVHVGDRVAAGQVLARLDSRELEARNDRVSAGLAGAEAAWKDALATATRIRGLYADSAAPKAQLDQAEAGLARTEAGVREARAAGAELAAVSDYATLRAPFAGIVTQRLADLGVLAAPGQPLLVIEDQARLRVAVVAAPNAVRGIRRGQRIEATVAGRSVNAVVEGMASAPGGDLVTVNALVENRDGSVFAGSAATLALPQGSRAGMLVPAAAIVREGDLSGVRVKRGGAWELRWVRIGAAQGGLVEALTGITAGDTVLVPRKA
jgi:membrane fusion protein, multidrug efflux system